MLDGFKLIAEVTTHTLRRTVGICQFGMAGLKVLEMVHQVIKLLITDLGPVKYVVVVIVTVQVCSQLQYLVLFGKHEGCVLLGQWGLWD